VSSGKWENWQPRWKMLSAWALANRISTLLRSSHKRRLKSDDQSGQLFHSTLANSVGQRAAIAALDSDPSIVEQMKARFAARIEFVYSRLKTMKGVRVLKSKGSFYIFVDISQISLDSVKFAIQLLQHKKIVVIPGYAFGESGEGCIRLACTRSRLVLEEGMNRFEAFIEGYKKIDE